MRLDVIEVHVCVCMCVFAHLFIMSVDNAVDVRRDQAVMLYSHIKHLPHVFDHIEEGHTAAEHECSSEK